MKRLAALVSALLCVGPLGCSDSSSPDVGQADASGDADQGDAADDAVPHGDQGDASDGGCTPQTCSALNVPGACTLFSCNQVTRECEERNAKQYVPCDDDNACTVGGYCDEGTCIQEQADCADGNPCTTDVCDPDTGCLNVPNSDPCDDGNACTTDEACAEGSCVATDTSACLCASDLDCAPFDDDNLCNGRVACIDGACAVSPGSVVSCPTAANTACFFTVCDPASGLCEATIPEGTPCSDGNGCTVGDSCAAGVCESGTSQCVCDVDADCADYEDGNICNGTLGCVDGLCQVDLATIVTCTDTSTAACDKAVCNADTGACEAVALGEGELCEDGDICTVGTKCTDSVCGGGVPLDCEDGNPCTDHSCDALTGCATTLTVCDDGDACTVDLCDESSGCTTVPESCDDGSVCTDDSCDPAVGCVAEPIECDDDDACTVDLCDTSGGCYSITQACPDDGNPCTLQACDPAVGCTATLLPCTDGNPCTTDSCDPASGACQFAPVDCSDDDPCTTETCLSGAGGCTDLGPPPCDDGDPCSDDFCVAGVGCSAQPKACDDDNACTADSCDPETGSCVYLAAPCDCGADDDCDDGNDCTSDSCDTALGECVFTDVGDGAPCDDGNACTEAAGTCDAGVCDADPIACPDDGDACTTASCDPDEGCETTPAIVCDDGDACTVDSCDTASGECVTTAQVCDDGDPCTGDSCDPGVGCQAVPLTCDDGDACTVDSCDPATGCLNAVLTCDDGDACTDDGCDPAAGCTATPTVCDDGDACTTDSCSPVLGCAATGAICDDRDPCTVDGCDPVTGCTATPVVCDDGVECTIDSCTAGVCSAVPGPSCGCETAADCDDGHACTSDECVDFGCAFTVTSGAGCDDGDGCTEGDTCDASGACSGTPVTCAGDGSGCTLESCQTPVVSAANCAELATAGEPIGLPENKLPETYGDPLVCGFSASGCLQADYDAARAYCESEGARLCTAFELLDDEAADTGCSFNGVFVWSSTGCAPGARIAVKQFPGGATSCLPTTDAAPVRCCGDVDPASVTGACRPELSQDCAGTACGAYCDPGADSCTDPIAACDDGDDCTEDACGDGGCQHTPVACVDDGDPCTLETCDPQQGCIATPVVCPDDGDPCTVETCDSSSGQCEASAKCQDDTACTQNVCNPATGECIYADACDDFNPCTTGTCEALGAAASASDCDTLGWAPVGTREVCAHPECELRTFDDAKAFCEGQGARLCFAEEVISEVVAGSCGVQAAWTADACSGGHVAATGLNVGQAAACVDDGDQRGTLCCADVAPASAGRCVQQPVADPDCLEIGDVAPGHGAAFMVGGQAHIFGKHVTMGLDQPSSKRLRPHGHWDGEMPSPLVSLGEFHDPAVCAIDALGRAGCTGDPFHWTATPGGFRLVSFAAGPVTHVTSNAVAACVVVAGEAYCWGRNDPGGSLGVGDTFDRPDPTPVVGLEGLTIEEVELGRRTGCVRTDEGDVWCWGEHEPWLQLGPDFSGAASFVPVKMNLPAQATALYGAKSDKVVRLSSGGLVGWGKEFTDYEEIMVGAPLVQFSRGSVHRIFSGVTAGGEPWMQVNVAVIWPPGVESSDAQPAPIGKRPVEYAGVGYRGACYLEAGTHLRCWGSPTSNNWPDNLPVTVQGQPGTPCDNDFACFTRWCNGGVCDVAGADDDGVACTTAHAQLTEVSALSCGDLPAFGFVGANTEVCGDSEPCTTNVDHATAQAACEALGARLCRYEEVVAGAVTGTGCGLDNDAIWTSTACGDGHFMTLRGNGDVNNSPAPACSPSDAPNVDVRCCADADLGRPRLCRQVPEWTPGQCCNAFDGTTSCP